MKEQTHIFFGIVCIMFLGLMGCSCVATPLPEPPHVDPGLITMETFDNISVEINGLPGAISPGDINVRATRIPHPTELVTPVRVIAPVGSNGSFTLLISGARVDTFALEAVIPPDDPLSVEPPQEIHLLTFTGADPAPTIRAIDPGDDRDGDGSPDNLDCAPDDNQRRGQDCP